MDTGEKTKTTEAKTKQKPAQKTAKIHEKNEPSDY